MLLVLVVPGELCVDPAEPKVGEGVRHQPLLRAPVILAEEHLLGRCQQLVDGCGGVGAPQPFIGFGGDPANHVPSAHPCLARAARRW